jgi:hypothetical protein
MWIETSPPKQLEFASSDSAITIRSKVTGYQSRGICAEYGRKQIGQHAAASAICGTNAHGIIDRDRL